MGGVFSKGGSSNQGRRHGSEYSKQNEQEESQGFKTVPEDKISGKFTDTKSYRNLKIVRQMAEEKHRDKPEKEKPKAVNYDYHKLDKFPEEILDNTSLTQLYMLNNRITNWAKIPVFVNLTTVDVSFNPIKKFPSEFTTLKKLESLSLSGCGLTDVHPGLADLSELQRIKLSLNELTIFPVFLLTLPHLQDLNLTGNQIDCWFPDERDQPFSPPDSTKADPNVYYLEDKRDDQRFAVNCSNLITLLLSRNRLPYLPNCLCLSEIRTLKISENRIKRLPKDMKYMKSLQVFSASYNNIQKIGRSFHGLKSLKILDLSHNKIKHISHKLFGDPHYSLPTLFEVFLDHNSITSLHKNFFQSWDLLSIVDLSCNQLIQLPPIGAAKNITKIFLGKNQLKELPPCLVKLSSKLEIFNISENQLQELPSFHDFESLRILELSYNPLDSSKLNSDVLPADLEELSLSGCGLKTYPSIAMKNLNYLNLAHNLISEMPTKLQCPGLKYFDFQFNPMKSLPSSIQEECSKLNCFIDMGDYEDPNIQTESNHFNIGVSEMIGKRPTMEDAVMIAPKFNGIASSVLLGLFDGHGGDQASRFCAKSLGHFYFEIYRSFHSDNAETIKKTLKKVFPKLETAFSREVQKEQKKALEDTRMGTTAIIMHIVNKVIYVANCGDSRAVMGLKDGTATRITHDHKPLDHAEIQRISALGGFVSETGRVNGQLAVSRSIGDFYLSPSVTCEPHLEVHPISPNFAIVIAACDGLWDVVSDQEAVDLALEMMNNGKTQPEIASSLRDIAYLRGSSDNISVITIGVKN